MKLKHIEKHLLEFTSKSQTAGYHGGLSLNVHAALLQESSGRVIKVLDSMYRRGLTNPFGCALTYCLIWYMRDISRDWESYGSRSFGISREDHEPIVNYDMAREEALKYADLYPGKGFESGGEREPTLREVKKVRTKLKLPTATKRMTDEECIYCNGTVDATPE